MVTIKNRSEMSMFSVQSICMRQISQSRQSYHINGWQIKISWCTPVVMVSTSRMRTFKCSFQELRKKKRKNTTRLDKVVAMKLEAVPVGFPVPYPLWSSGEDWIPAVVTGDLPRDPTPVHRSNDEDLGLAVAPYALGKPTGLPIASHCHDRKDQE